MYGIRMALFTTYNRSASGCAGITPPPESFVQLRIRRQTERQLYTCIGGTTHLLKSLTLIMLYSQRLPDKSSNFASIGAENSVFSVS